MIQEHDTTSIKCLNSLSRQIGLALAVIALFFSSCLFATNELDLPDLNQAGNSLMSDVQERELGQAWLRSFRAAAPLEQDPQIFEYVESLLMKLASNSELENRELDLVVVDNKTINAFAVPGGIVGVHTGLLLQANTEGQFASVLGHELAHLSQHHFARSVEAARRANLASLTGMLAGIVLAATSGGESATAALAASQAAALDTQLRYSRIHEREADRLGMKTLTQSGYQAGQAAAMFRGMQEASRYYGSSLPEFLRTHPVTQSRIADAENRARQIGVEGTVDSLDFQLIKARAYVLSLENPSDGVKHFARILESLEKNPSNNQQLNQTAARYGLSLSLIKDEKWEQARQAIEPLLDAMPVRLGYILLDISIDAESGNTTFAEKRLRDLYSVTPGNYSIGMALADVSIKSGNYSTAQRVLNELGELRPAQADIWYLLAEVNGLAGDIIELHQARAEFFILRNNLDQAHFHLKHALKLTRSDFRRTAHIKQRLRFISKLQRQQRASG